MARAFCAAEGFNDSSGRPRDSTAGRHLKRFPSAFAKAADRRVSRAWREVSCLTATPALHARNPAAGRHLKRFPSACAKAADRRVSRAWRELSCLTATLAFTAGSRLAVE